MLEACFIIDYDERPSATELMQFPFFQDALRTVTDEKNMDQWNHEKIPTKSNITNYNHNM